MNILKYGLLLVIFTTTSGVLVTLSAHGYTRAIFSLFFALVATAVLTYWDTIDSVKNK